MSTQAEEGPYESAEYQRFVEEMAKYCECLPLERRPCDGVLAGGFCDRMGQEPEEEEEDLEHEYTEDEYND